MHQAVRGSVASLVVNGLFTLAMISAAPGAQTTENFDTDPGWIGVRNTVDDNDFGWSQTNLVGTNAGEIGGIFASLAMGTEAEPIRTSAYYADEVTGLSGDTPLQATGRYGWDEISPRLLADSGWWNIGWFSSDYDNSSTPGGFPNFALVLSYASRNHFLFLVKDGVISQEAFVMGVDPVSPGPAGSVNHPPSIDGCTGAQNETCGYGTSPDLVKILGGKNFDLQYDPDANGGLGALSVAISTDDPNYHTFAATLNLTQAERDALNLVSLDRFGILNRGYVVPEFYNPNIRRTQAWFDDLTYTSSADVVGVAGDYNGNGEVDAADYAVWRDGGSLQNEVETIGTVGPEDYDAWRARFSNNGSGSGIDASAVPEPVSALLLVIGMFGLGIRRRG